MAGPEAAPGDNIAPRLAAALAMLPPDLAAAVVAAIGGRPMAAWELRAARLAARDEALRQAAGLMPQSTLTGRARALAAALARGADRRGDDAVDAALQRALALNGGAGLAWRRLRDILAAECQGRRVALQVR